MAMQISSRVKDTLRYIIYKLFGSASFIRRIEWKFLINWLDPRDGERILDVACGTGELTVKIAKRVNAEVYGLDISRSAILKAKSLAERENVSPHFVIADAEAIPFKDESFDKIVCSSSLEHFKNDIKALKEMRRVLKMGGIVVLTVDSVNIELEGLKEHRYAASVVNYYDITKIEKALEMSGFKVLLSKDLINSALSKFFFKLGVKLKWSGIAWIVMSIVVYPLCLASDKYFGKRNGYTLILKAEKK